jgi:hypothetical protein
MSTRYTFRAKTPARNHGHMLLHLGAASRREHSVALSRSGVTRVVKRSVKRSGAAAFMRF